MATAEQMLHAMGMMLEKQTAVLTSFADRLQANDQPKKNDHLLAKHFRIENYDGDRSKWDDWNFAFKRNVRSLSRIAYDRMEKWEGCDEEVCEKTDFNENQECLPV